MRSQILKNHRFLFYFCWFLLAASQASAMELIADEAYYWVYSRHLSWGYFDHPPLVALLIKWGYGITGTELGVRLVFVILNVMTIRIIERLTDQKDPILFYTIVVSIGFLQVGGILAVPDTPLLFFTALFFLKYRSYTTNPGWKNAFLLSVVIALLFYSKYHGLLIVLFTFLSNLKLLKRSQTWAIVLFVIVLYSPHLVWQWQHQWVSFRYHLFESNVNQYRVSITTDYFLGQILMAGPLAGLILIPASIIYRPKNELEKALKFTLIGIYVFFFISSFRGKVEANWTMPVLIPLILLAYNQITGKSSWLKPLKITAAISLLLITAGRIYLIEDIGPDNAVKKRFLNNRSWAKGVAEKTGNLPVVWYNSYQRASMYWFYTGIISHSHNSIDQRRSNFNFWPTESNLFGRPVFIADIHNTDSFPDSVSSKKGWVTGFRYDSSYRALGELHIIPEQNRIVLGENKSIHIKCRSKIPDKYKNHLLENSEQSSEILAVIFKGKNIVHEIKTGIQPEFLAHNKQFAFHLDLSAIPQGHYDLRFAIKTGNYLPTHNSDKIRLEID